MYISDTMVVLRSILSTIKRKKGSCFSLFHVSCASVWMNEFTQEISFTNFVKEISNRQ